MSFGNQLQEQTQTVTCNSLNMIGLPKEETRLVLSPSAPIKNEPRYTTGNTNSVQVQSVHYTGTVCTVALSRSKSAFLQFSRQFKEDSLHL